MAYDVLDNVYSIFMDVKTGVGGSSGSNTFYNTDVNTSFIEIILTERDKNLTMTDYTYIVSVDKADGTSYVNRYTASEANKMSIKLDTQLLACEGECTAQLYVLKDDKVRTMMEFNYFVKNGVFDGAKPPSHNEDSIYISLTKEFTDLKENVLIAIGKMDGIERTLESQGASITEQGEKISKNETDITQNKKDIKANTAEINKAKTATTGEKFGSVSERIDAEVSRINNKIEVSFVPQEEAESHTILNTVEGMSTDMIVKGRTLQNLISIKPAKNAGDIQIEKLLKSELFKVGNTYTVNIPNRNNKQIIIVVKTKDGVTKNINLSSTTNTFTVEEDYPIVFSLTLHSTNGWDVNTDLKNADTTVVLEGDWTNKPIPEYFEGIKSFGQEEDKISILSHGKNLFNVNEAVYGLLNVGTGELHKSDESKTSNYIKVKKNKNYVISGDGEIRTYYGIFCNSNKQYISQKEFSKNIPINFDEDGYFRFSYASEKDNSSTPATNIMFEEGTQATQYEPYKEDKKEIQLSKYGFEEGLRGLNNTVYDELNSIRDVAVKRVGKYTFTGNETSIVKWVTVTDESFIGFCITNDDIPNLTSNGSLVICNNFPSTDGVFNKRNMYIAGNRANICIEKSALTTPDIEGFKAWLKANQTTIYYELAEPVETPITDPINVKTFNEKTYVSFINTLKGTSSFKTPVDTIQTIARLTSENKSLLSSNAELDAKVTEAVKKNQQLKEEAIATQSALDYILMNTLKA